MAGYCGTVWTGFGRPDERRDVLLELAPLSLCIAAVGTSVAAIALACWFWTASLQWSFLFALWQTTSMVLKWKLGFVVVLQSISVSFRSLCPSTVQVSSHFMLLRCIILYIFSLLLLKVALRPFLSEERHLQIVSVDWVWTRNAEWT